MVRYSKIEIFMKHILNLCVIAVLMLMVVGCASKPKIMVPPKVDLTKYEIIGIIEFKSSNEGKLGEYATGKFMEVIRKDQQIVRIINLGTESECLKAIGHKQLDHLAFKSLGEKYEISSIISGEFVVSDVRPNINIMSGLKHMRFEAEVDAKLNSQMVETATGASIWNGSANTTKEVGSVSIFGGKNFVFDADAPETAYGKLVDALVYKITKDFRVTWRRQRK